MSFYIRSSCRLCNSKQLEIVLDLQPSPLCDAYVKEKRDQEFYEMKLQRCKECEFIQLGVVVDPKVIYSDYLHVTTNSVVHRAAYTGLSVHFETYARSVTQKIGLNPGDLVTDICSNDGSLLKYFAQGGLSVLGIEPAIETAKVANKRGVKTYCEFFSEDVVNLIQESHGKAKVITINNLFANIDDLTAFINIATNLLDKDGCLVIESSYLFDMIDHMVFELIYHEHLSYFSLNPLQGFFAKFGMEIWAVEHINTKGGSLRYYISKIGIHPVEDSVSDFSRKELAGISVRDKFMSFADAIGKQKESLTTFLQSLKGKVVVGYGASATSTTLISHFGLQEYLSYLVDDNPAKIDTYSPGYQIPVYSSNKLIEDEPDVILILAWRFVDEILPKIRKSNAVKVVPLPKFKVL